MQKSINNMIKPLTSNNPPTGWKRWLKRNPHLPYVTPTLVIMTLLFVVPILFVFIISLTNYTLGAPLDQIRFLGFSNYIRLFNGVESGFFNAIYLSLIYTVLGTLFQLIIGMSFAMLLNYEFRFKSVVIACMIIPIAMTPSISSQIWKLLFNKEFGVINFFLHNTMGFTVSWMDPKYAFMSVLIATVWQYTPFVTLMLYAGLRSLPEDPYESAELEGASKLQMFVHITLPMMKRLIYLCVLLRTIDMLKVFDIPYVLTQGGPGTATQFLGLLIFDTGFGEANFVSRASAMAVVLIVIISVLSLFYFRAMAKARED